MAELCTTLQTAELNDLTIPGKYYIVKATADYPAAFSQYIGLEVIKFYSSIIQKAYCIGEIIQYTYIRKYSGYHGWTSWAVIDNPILEE